MTQRERQADIRWWREIAQAIEQRRQWPCWCGCGLTWFVDEMGLCNLAKPKRRYQQLLATMGPDRSGYWWTGEDKDGRIIACCLIATLLESGDL